MIDIHSHIIYGIDDGARTLEEAVALVKDDVSQGAELIIATPHYYVDEPTDPDEIREKLAELKAAVKADPYFAEHPVELIAGNEVLWFDSMTEKLKSGEILPLGDTKFTLVEFFPAESYETILRAVKKIRSGGYRPVVAHAERFQALREHGLSEVIERGAYVQLSTEPYGGGLFDKTAKFVKQAAKKGEVHFLGTDMHRPDRRPPKAAAAVKWIGGLGNAGQEILRGNAREMLKDSDFLWE